MNGQDEPDTGADDDVEYWESLFAEEHTSNGQADEPAATSNRRAPAKRATGALAKIHNAANLPPPDPIRWLAIGWILRAGLNVLIGPEGIGKSLFWVELVARITTGRAFRAINMERRKPRHVVVVLTEDTRSEAEARLQLAGADLNLVHYVSRDEGDLSQPPVFPDDFPVVEQAIRDVDAVLCVVDAWLDIVPPTLNIQRPQDAKTALRPWRAVAISTGAAMLLIGNTNRMSTEATIRDRIAGTQALRQTVRSLLFAA